MVVRSGGCSGVSSGVSSSLAVTVANQAQSDTQKLCERCLWMICGVKLLPSDLLTFVCSLCAFLAEKQSLNLGSSMLRCCMTHITYRTT